MSSQDTVFKENFILRYGGKSLDLSSAKVMGIINLTPNSFFTRGKYKNHAAILALAGKMISEGASILDLGAVSTRPGAPVVEEVDERKRLLPLLRKIRKTFPDVFISIDTFRTVVARSAIDHGADIINDVYAGSFDGKMEGLVSREKIPYIIMHMQGTPQNMQLAPAYKNVVREVQKFFAEKIASLREKKIKQIIIDPGFGFGKTVEHNFKLLKGLEKLQVFGYPVLAGVSRKSMVNRVIGTRPETALNGTTAVHTIAVLNGARILRVHDVKEAVQAIRIAEFYKSV